jgi:hypothetical protein
VKNGGCALFFMAILTAAMLLSLKGDLENLAARVSQLEKQFHALEGK